MYRNSSSLLQQSNRRRCNSETASVLRRIFSLPVTGNYSASASAKLRGRSAMKKLRNQLINLLIKADVWPLTVKQRYQRSAINLVTAFSALCRTGMGNLIAITGA